MLENKKFVIPEAYIISFSEEDIITESAGVADFNDEIDDGFIK